MCHGGSGRCTMPVLDARRNPNNIALANYLNRAVPLLNPANAIGHDQDLTQRMGVPCRSCSGLERNLAPGRTGRFLRIEKRLDANRPREAIRSACDGLLEDCWRDCDL